MGQNFVPEMHDLGKLAVSQIAGSHHDFSKADWTKFTEPQNLTWYGIRYHMTLDELRDLNKPIPTKLSPSLENPAYRKTLFILVLADRLASTIGRAERQGKAVPSPLLYKLWNPAYSSKASGSSEPICDDNSLANALSMVQLDPKDSTDFFQMYDESLHIKGEDETTPNNVTSLYSHIELTGKFYRILEKEIGLTENPLAVSLYGEVVTKVTEAEERWVYSLVVTRVKFHQQPVRPGDLAVFQQLAICKREFAKKYPDNLLCDTSDSFWLFLSGKSENSLEDMLKIFTDAGFYLECEIQEASSKRLSSIESSSHMRMLIQSQEELSKTKNEAQQKINKNTDLINWLNREIDNLNKNLNKSNVNRNKELGQQKIEALKWSKDLQVEIGNIEKNLTEAEGHIKALEKELVENPVRWDNSAFYPKDIQPTVTPQLCEICQMRHGEEVRVLGVIEHICPRCQDIRQRGSTQRKLSWWLQEDEKLLWLKITLEPQSLRECIQFLFGEYVDSLKKENGEILDFAERLKLKLEVRMISLLADFVKDYNSMLTEMGKGLRGKLRNIEQLDTTDMWVMPIWNGLQVREALRLYFDLMDNSFPRLLTIGSIPIKLGVSLAAAKYPFFQHWRYIVNPQKPVNIDIVGKTRLETTTAAMIKLLEVDLGDRNDRSSRRGRSYMHDLACIEEETGSSALAQVKFLSDLQRHRGVPDILLPLADPLRNGVISMRDILSYHKITTWNL